ncbi:MAG: hypothetical protein IPM54_00175 [Polyangiaceae bacterium]|nr:hypothetical protein [Polyangiaceae bacterium]
MLTDGHLKEVDPRDGLSPCPGQTSWARTMDTVFTPRKVQEKLFQDMEDKVRNKRHSPTQTP